MKTHRILASLAAIALLATSCAQGQNAGLKTDADSLSYAIGLGIGDNLKNMEGIEVNVDAFVQAIRDVMADRAVLTMDQAEEVIARSYERMQQSAYADNIQAEQAFLEENGRRPEVTTLPSGLQYEVLREGKGEVPTADSRVECHYVGTLSDGTPFDSSVERGEPITFGVTQVIRGWTEALQLMPVGSKWRLYIPSELAYGASGAGGGLIPPYSALIFEVELLRIVD